MTTAHREPSPSEPARTAMNWLEYLTQVLSDTPALTPSTLVRADLCDVDGEAVAAELEHADLVTRTADGIAPTGKDRDRPHHLAARSPHRHTAPPHLGDALQPTPSTPDVRPGTD